MLRIVWVGAAHAGKIGSCVPCTWMSALSYVGAHQNAILWLLWLAGEWVRFATFGAGFAIKLVDIACAACSVKAGAINGTSVFHLLTCTAMYLHYAAVL